MDSNGFLAIVNNATKNISVHILVQICAFSFYGYIPRRGIAGSYAKSIFNFLRNCHSVIHSKYTIFHFHQQSARVSLNFSVSLPTLAVFLDFCLFVLIVAFLMGVGGISSLLTICISLMISDFEHLYMCLLAICISSLEKHLFQSFPHF